MQPKQNATLMSSLGVLFFISGGLLLAGCSSPMALKTTSKDLKLDKQSIAIFTLSGSNQYKPSYAPSDIRYVEVVARDSRKKAKFGVEKPYAKSDTTQDYLICVAVKPGTYTVGDINGFGGNPWGLFVGKFCSPINGTFEVPERSVIYVGHVDMINRKRREGEPRSGSIFPLIDQAAAGFSDGTFDVTISDRSNTDIPIFRQTYPCLRDIEIAKSIMQTKQ